jgi:hypothetical protein
MLSQKQIDDFVKFPAVRSSSPIPEVYFLKDDKIVGKGRIGSRYMGHITVYLDRDPETLEYFKDDWAVTVLGKDAPFRFHEVMGTPLPAFPDEPEGRLEGVTVVDCFEFDFGYTSDRYAHIEGFGVRSTAPSVETA